MDVVFVVASLLMFAVVAANILATRLVARDTLLEKQRKLGHLLLIWLIPVLGALIVFAMHRFSEKP